MYIIHGGRLIYLCDYSVFVLELSSMYSGVLCVIANYCCGANRQPWVSSGDDIILTQHHVPGFIDLQYSIYIVHSWCL